MDTNDSCFKARKFGWILGAMPLKFRGNGFEWFWLLLLASFPFTALAELSLIETDESIEILIDGKPVFKYNIAVVEPPEGKDAVYARSGFIHPVYTPDGAVITDGFPEGHTHQHAVFMAWTRSTYKGGMVDFWNAHKRLGRVFHAEVIAVERSKDCVSFKVGLKHQELNSPERDVVLDEIWELRAYPKVDDCYVFDLKSTQTTATDEPLVLNEYHYGGMGLRLTREWSPESPSNRESLFEFSMSGGQGRIEGNHTRQHWVAASGLIEGQPASIAVLGHPENFRAPQPVRIHPRIPYFSYSPIVLGEFEIQAGEAYVSRYRYIVSSKHLDSNWLDHQWKEYAKEK